MKFSFIIRNSKCGIDLVFIVLVLGIPHNLFMSWSEKWNQSKARICMVGENWSIGYKALFTWLIHVNSYMALFKIAYKFEQL